MATDVAASLRDSPLMKWIRDSYYLKNSTLVILKQIVCSCTLDDNQIPQKLRKVYDCIISELDDGNVSLGR
jgi:hypothetical protein